MKSRTAVSLVHTNRSGDYFLYAGLSVVAGNKHEGPILWGLVDGFVGAVGREGGDVSVLEAEFLHRGKPEFLARSLVVNLVRNLILVVKLRNTTVAKFLFQRHMRFDLELFFTEMEPGSLFQRIHVWPREKLQMANCIPGSFSPIACASHAHCRLNRAESNGSWGELEQVAELHAVNLQSAANWVQSGNRRAVDQPLVARMDYESI